MALSKLPCKPTPICVECKEGPTAYAKGGFTIHVSCIPGLRGLDDILAVYLRQPHYCSCAVLPVISGIVPVSAAGAVLQFSNDIQMLAYGVQYCSGAMVSAGMQEISAGANLSNLTFCVTVKGR